MPMANMNFGVNVLPKQSDTYSLGNSEKQWQIHASTINGISFGNAALLTEGVSTITGAINKLAGDVSALNARVGTVEAPASVFADFPFTLESANWTAITGGYKYELTNASITSTCGIWVFYDSSYNTNAKAGISSCIAATSNDTPCVLFETATAPTGNITGYIRVIDSIECTPISRGGTGADNAAQARSNLGVPSTDVATTSVNGLMSAADKTKLDGIATNANNYTHPTTAGNKHIPSGGSSGQWLKYSAAGTATWASLPTASSSTAGITKVGASGGAAAYSHEHSSLHGSDGQGLKGNINNLIPDAGCMKSGWYYNNENISGIGYPADDTILFVIAFTLDSNAVFQIALSSTNKFYSRYRSWGTWSQWSKYQVEKQVANL